MKMKICKSVLCTRVFCFLLMFILYFMKSLRFHKVGLIVTRYILRPTGEMMLVRLNTDEVYDAVCLLTCSETCWMCSASQRVENPYCIPIHRAGPQSPRAEYGLDKCIYRDHLRTGAEKFTLFSYLHLSPISISCYVMSSQRQMPESRAKREGAGGNVTSRHRTRLVLKLVAISPRVSVTQCDQILSFLCSSLIDAILNQCYIFQPANQPFSFPTRPLCCVYLDNMRK